MRVSALVRSDTNFILELAMTTAGRLDLSAWFTEAGSTHVAMKATGVYWKQVGTSSKKSQNR